MKMPWESAIENVTGLLSEYIEDPDKQAEIKLKLSEALLQTATTPKTDAFVKILIAFRDILLPLLRPLGAAAMTAAGLYFQYKGIEVDTAVEAVTVGAFPAWGASRHVHKQKSIEYEDWDTEDD